MVAGLPEGRYRAYPPRSPTRSQRSRDRAPGRPKWRRRITRDLDSEALEGARDDRMQQIADRIPDQALQVNSPRAPDFVSN